jgi:phosphoenolpyruvate carboxykinase (GTP)
MRILNSIVERARGHALGKETALGWSHDITWDGLDFRRRDSRSFQDLDRTAWQREIIRHEEFYPAAKRGKRDAFLTSE